MTESTKGRYILRGYFFGAILESQPKMNHYPECGEGIGPMIRRQPVKFLRSGASSNPQGKDNRCAAKLFPTGKEVFYIGLANQ